MDNELCTRVCGLSRESKKKFTLVNSRGSQWQAQVLEDLASKSIPPTPNRSKATQVDSTKVDALPGYPMVMTSPEGVTLNVDITSTSEPPSDPSTVGHSTMGMLAALW